MVLMKLWGGVDKLKSWEVFVVKNVQKFLGLDKKLLENKKQLYDQLHQFYMEQLPAFLDEMFELDLCIQEHVFNEPPSLVQPKRQCILNHPASR